MEAASVHAHLSIDKASLLPRHVPHSNSQLYRIGCRPPRSLPLHGYIPDHLSLLCMLLQESKIILHDTQTVTVYVNALPDFAFFPQLKSSVTTRCIIPLPPTQSLAPRPLSIASMAPSPVYLPGWPQGELQAIISVHLLHPEPAR